VTGSVTAHIQIGADFVTCDTEKSDADPDGRSVSLSLGLIKRHTHAPAYPQTHSPAHSLSTFCASPTRSESAILLIYPLVIHDSSDRHPDSWSSYELLVAPLLFIAPETSPLPTYHFQG